MLRKYGVSTKYIELQTQFDYSESLQERNWKHVAYFTLPSTSFSDFLLSDDYPGDAEEAEYLTSTQTHQPFNSELWK